MVKPLFRAAFALSIAGAAACGPLLGLDDLFERPRESGRDAGADADADVVTSASDAGDGAVGCTTNVQCKPPNGSAALCVSGKCVPVADFCLPEVLPNNDALEKDDVALFAAFLPFQGGQAPLSQPPALSYALAIDELSLGIPYNESGSTRRRPVALVICPSEPDVIEDSIEHVTRDLHVAAMIASFDNATLPTLVQNHAKPEGVFTLNPSTTTEALRYQPDPLVWNLLGVPEDVALAYRPLLAGVEEHLRSTTLDDGGAMRVALLATNTSTEESIRDLLEKGRRNLLDGGVERDRALHFNGQDLPDMHVEEDGGRASFLSISVNAFEKSESPKFAEIAGALTSFDPHVVIALTVNEIDRIVRDVEPRDGGAGITPTWILGPRNAEYVRPYLAESSQSFAEKQPRFLGVQYAGAADPTQRGEWLTRMATKYGPPSAVDYSATENFYDAVYWLAYGAAYPDGPLTGEAISKGVRRLLEGPPIFPGSVQSVSDAFTVLAIGGSGTYTGALGPPEIDAKLGTWNSVGGVYCFAAQSGVITPKYDVLRYERASGKLAQRSQCFPGQFMNFGLN